MYKLTGGIVGLFFILPTIVVAAPNSAELVIYSSRKEQLLQPLIDAYQSKTKQSVKVVYDSEGPLLERLKSEGTKSSADLLLTVDAGNLWRAADMGLLQPTKSAVLEKEVPESLRDPQGQWFGLTRRVRAIIYDPRRVKVEELSSYEDLASPKWKKKLCLRSSSKVYNQSLVAMMIERIGPDETKKVVSGWVNNLAAQVFSDDSALIKAMANGPCQVGLVNSYYLARMIEDDAKFPVKIFWPNQTSSGAHVNISGAGITKASTHKEAAQKFLEWMASSEAQKILSDTNLEYPVKADGTAQLKPVLKQFGPFKADTLNLKAAGQRQAEAVRLMDSVKYK